MRRIPRTAVLVSLLLAACSGSKWQRNEIAGLMRNTLINTYGSDEQVKAEYEDFIRFYPEH
jgi:hypothetical protein